MNGTINPNLINIIGIFRSSKHLILEIIKVRRPDKISNDELWRRTKQHPFEEDHVQACIKYDKTIIHLEPPKEHEVTAA
ncbi:hypothetical protein DPMN_054628 [Dreissena polymorpha]|uniref:Uncharacterized protein n=1 Tax=Dreissena polymorpha TaxID=45954 RepID=A0A9D4CQ03_DREPO|nr:hypothetical protein DPMN_054628 [Dreissena polymorpha]